MKVHLVRGSPLRRRARSACGIYQPSRRTNVPPEVTCRACQGTLQMADAEKEFYAKRGKGAW